MSRSPRIAIVGATGQVARALAIASRARGNEAVAGGRPDVDVACSDSIDRFLAAAAADVVVNAAAYTAVDKAESEPALATAVNAVGAGHVAAACARRNLPLVHISTDYVFDGCKGQPYVDTDPVRPLGVYGRSKADGEDEVRTRLERHVIVRTSWVYSALGSNFLLTMLRLAAERDEVRVVADQWGSPTYAVDLAHAILDIAGHITRSSIADEAWGTYHLTGSGETTWHGFAEAIFAEAARYALRTPRLTAITTAEYPSAARRPAYSVLANDKIIGRFAISLADWRDGTRRCVAEIIKNRT